MPNALNANGNNMRFKLESMSLLDLLAKYGVGDRGFALDWWKNKPFAQEKCESGEYEIDFGENLRGLSYAKQSEKMREGYEPASAAMIAQAVLQHYAQTGEKLLPNFEVRTRNKHVSSLRVVIGYFLSDGLHIGYWGGRPHRRIGLASARKS
jgi:hypothetical protein